MAGCAAGWLIAVAMCCALADICPRSVSDTLGWSLLIIVIFVVLLDRFLSAKREGRLDTGIDPPAFTEQRLATVNA